MVEVGPCRESLCLNWVSLRGQTKLAKSCGFGLLHSNSLPGFITRQRLLVACFHFHSPFLPYNGNFGFQLEIWLPGIKALFSNLSCSLIWPCDYILVNEMHGLYAEEFFLCFVFYIASLLVSWNILFTFLFLQAFFFSWL